MIKELEDPVTYVGMLSASKKSISFFVFFFIFISIYPLYMGGIHCDNFKYPYTVHWLNHPHSLPSTETPSLPHLQHLQGVSLLISYTYVKHKRCHFLTASLHGRKANELPSALVYALTLFIKSLLSWPNHLQKATLLKTVTWGIMFKQLNFEGTQALRRAVLFGSWHSMRHKKHLYTL
jgi:hypothetical protein